MNIENRICENCKIEKNISCYYYGRKICKECLCKKRRDDYVKIPKNNKTVCKSCKRKTDPEKDYNGKRVICKICEKERYQGRYSYKKIGGYKKRQIDMEEFYKESNTMKRKDLVKKYGVSYSTVRLWQIKSK